MAEPSVIATSGPLRVIPADPPPGETDAGSRMVVEFVTVHHADSFHELGLVDIREDGRHHFHYHPRIVREDGFGGSMAAPTLQAILTRLEELGLPDWAGPDVPIGEVTEDSLTAPDDAFISE